MRFIQILLFVFCLVVSLVSSFLYNVYLFILALESSFYMGIRFPPIAFPFLLKFYMVIKINEYYMVIISY